MALDVKVRKHTVRFVYSRNGRAGMFGPHVSVHLKGPNGSPAGVGPKAWHWLLRPLFPYYDKRMAGYGPPTRWNKRASSLWVPVPHVPWSLHRRLGYPRIVGWLYRKQNELLFYREYHR